MNTWGSPSLGVRETTPSEGRIKKQSKLEERRDYGIYWTAWVIIFNIGKSSDFRKGSYIHIFMHNDFLKITLTLWLTTYFKKNRINVYFHKIRFPPKQVYSNLPLTCRIVIVILIWYLYWCCKEGIPLEDWLYRIFNQPPSPTPRKRFSDIKSYPNRCFEKSWILLEMRNTCCISTFPSWGHTHWIAILSPRK